MIMQLVRLYLTWCLDKWTLVKGSTSS